MCVYIYIYIYIRYRFNATSHFHLPSAPTGSRMSFNGLELRFALELQRKPRASS